MRLWSRILSRLGQFSQILLMRLYAAGAGFALTLLLVRVLGPAEYGIYVFALGWVSIGVLFTTLGFHQFAVRAIPPMLIRKQTAELRGFLIFAVSVVVLLSALVAGGVWVNPAIFTNSTAMQTATPLAALILIPRSLALLRTGVLQGLGHPVAGQFPERLVEPTLLLLAVLIFTVTALPRSADAVLVLSIIVACISLLSGARSLLRALCKFSSQPEFAGMSDWVIGALKSSLVFAAATVLGATDVVMLGLLSTPEETGVYGVATRFFLLMGLPFHAAVVQISQQAASLHAKNDHVGLSAMARAAANRGFIATALLAIPSTALAVNSDLVFGAGFEPAMMLIMILVWTRVLLSAAGQPGPILANTQFVGQVAIIACLTVLLNIGLNALLIPLYGAIGAAAATATSFATMTIANVIAMRRQLGFTSFIFFG